MPSYSSDGAQWQDDNGCLIQEHSIQLIKGTVYNSNEPPLTLRNTETQRRRRRVKKKELELKITFTSTYWMNDRQKNEDEKPGYQMALQIDFTIDDRRSIIHGETSWSAPHLRRDSKRALVWQVIAASQPSISPVEDAFKKFFRGLSIVDRR